MHSIYNFLLKIYHSFKRLKKYPETLVNISQIILRILSGVRMNGSSLVHFIVKQVVVV